MFIINSIILSLLFVFVIIIIYISSNPTIINIHYINNIHRYNAHNIQFRLRIISIIIAINPRITAIIHIDIGIHVKLLLE